MKFLAFLLFSCSMSSPWARADWKAQRPPEEDFESDYRDIKTIERWIEAYRGAAAREREPAMRYLVGRLRGKRWEFDFQKNAFESARAGHAAAVRVALENGADCGARDFGKLDLLMAAVEGGKARVARDLLRSRKCDLGAQAPGSLTAFGMAVRAQNVALIKAFVEAGADRGLAAVDGGEPVEWLARQRNEVAIEALLPDAASARRYRTSTSRETLLHLAAKFGSPDLADYALKADTWVGSLNELEETAFDVALAQAGAAGGKERKSGDRPNQQDRPNRHDVQGRQADFLRVAGAILKREPAFINRPNRAGRHPLAEAIDARDETLVDWVLRQRPDPALESVNPDQTTTMADFRRVEAYLEDAGLSREARRSFESMRLRLRDYAAAFKRETAPSRPLAFASFEKMREAYDALKRGDEARVARLLGGGADRAAVVPPLQWGLLDFAVLDQDAALIERLAKKGYYTSITGHSDFNPRNLVGFEVSAPVESTLQRWGFDAPYHKAKRILRLTSLMGVFLGQEDSFAGKRAVLDWLLSRPHSRAVATAVFFAALERFDLEGMKLGLDHGIDLTMVSEEEFPSPSEGRLRSGLCRGDAACARGILDAVSALIARSPDAGDLYFRPQYAWLPPISAGPDEERACREISGDLNSADFARLRAWRGSRRIDLGKCVDPKAADAALLKLFEDFRRKSHSPFLRADVIAVFYNDVDLLASLGADVESLRGQNEDFRPISFFERCLSYRFRKASPPIACAVPGAAGTPAEADGAAQSQLREKSDAVYDLYQDRLRALEQNAGYIGKIKKRLPCDAIGDRAKEEFLRERARVRKALERLFKPIFDAYAGKSAAVVFRRRAKKKELSSCAAEKENFLRLTASVEDLLDFAVCERGEALVRLRRRYSRLYSNKLNSLFDSGGKYLCESGERSYSAGRSSLLGYSYRVHSDSEDVPYFASLEGRENVRVSRGALAGKVFSAQEAACKLHLPKEDLEIEDAYPLWPPVEVRVRSAAGAPPLEEQLAEQVAENMVRLRLGKLEDYKRFWYPQCAGANAGSP